MIASFLLYYDIFSLNRPRILVVEDEFIIRMLLSDRLREEDYDVIEAASADEALALMHAVVPDLIISDVQMSGSMDGIGLLNAVKQIHPTIPVIMVSAHFDPAAAIADGAAEFIAKPYTTELVLASVENLLPKSIRCPAGPTTNNPTTAAI